MVICRGWAPRVREKAGKSSEVLPATDSHNPAPGLACEDWAVVAEAKQLFRPSAGAIPE
jgi:hypothetical protein